MEKTLNTEFETDVDIITYNEVVSEACELADIFGLSYRVLQQTKEKTNICVTFEEDKIDAIQEFIISIKQINNLKENEINSRF